MNFIKELFNEKGNISSIRVTLIAGVIMIMFLVYLIGFVVFKQIDMNYIDKIIFAIGTIAGIFLIGKVSQRFAETKENKSVTIETNIDSTAERIITKEKTDV
jgi:hypothetical protein